MDIEKEQVERKKRDINAIEFGDTLEDVSSSLLIVMTLFEVDDDPEVIMACKYKLYEGIALLKKFGDNTKAKEVEDKLKK